MKSISNISGVGLRLPHLTEMVATLPPIGWLEVHPENFLANPHATELLTELSAHYPISFHTVGISVGSVGGIDRFHLKRLRSLIDRIHPILISGHLAWSTYANDYLNDLLPIPCNEEALRVVTVHVEEVQDVLGRPYLIENPATYVGFCSSTMPETEFLSELVHRTGCKLLCDVSNIVVSSHNMGYSAYRYIDDFPADAIGEIHLGGYTPEEGEATSDSNLWIDTHAAPIAAPSWDLYVYALRRFGSKPTLVEWDNDIPPLSALLEEATKVDKAMHAADRPCVDSGKCSHNRSKGTMPTLAETQLRFRDAVVQGDMRHVSSLASLLVGGRSPEQRLMVHQRNYRQSLVDALLTKFPATGWLLGTPMLTEAATRFIREYPPQAPCIAEFGAGFPDFLSQSPAVVRAPYVPEFAELEWYVGKVAIAVSGVPVTLEELSFIHAESLLDTLLEVQPGLHYLSTSWPVDELMKRYLSETAPERFELSPAEVDIEVRGARGELHLSRLDPAEATFRKAISEGRSIGHAAESALEVNAGFDPGKGLVALVDAGLIQAIRKAPDQSSRL